MRSKVKGLWPAAAFTGVMLFLVGIGAAVVASGRHYEGISIITLGAWTWMAWAAGYGMHAWKRHSEVIAEIRDTMNRMEGRLSSEQRESEPAAPRLRVVPPLR